MKTIRIIVTLFAMLPVLGGMAQSRDTKLNIEVHSLDGDRLAGQAVSLTQTDFGVSYGAMKLDAEGKCSLKVYAGPHMLKINRTGFDELEHVFTVADGQTEQTVKVSLVESARTPFALEAVAQHNAYTGINDISVAWNTEAPAFFDDFESYTPWAISFSPWSGIDVDKEAAAPLVGNYPNRGGMQYAQIINPLTVEPTWWYDYPVLRPYSGQQYVGFVRTSTGSANNDWLISPSITVGTDNILAFMAKAADQYAERFMVYVTEKLDNPGTDDFTRIDKGNFESVDYRGWKEFVYDLSSYAGKTIKFAIQYIGDAKRYGAFMLMVDDVYVGQAAPDAVKAAKAHRVAKSPANPYEKFEIYLDGVLKGTTDAYQYVLPDVAAGKHEIGVKAIYRQAQSETAKIEIDVNGTDYAKVSFTVTADSKLSPDGTVLELVNLSTAEDYAVTVAEGKAEIPSLPFGEYAVKVEQGAFEAYAKNIAVSADATFDIALKDYVMVPYNVTSMLDEAGDLNLRWNQILGFYDSFEDYDDFAVGSFGDWKSLNLDGMPVYPIALGNQSNLVSFPGSGVGDNPKPIAPIVFNPWTTTPAMMPHDPAIGAPTGDKQIVFFSAQRGKSDKWLISPKLEIYRNYELRFKAKAYTSAYQETLEICVSDGNEDPSNFTAISEVSQLPGEMWSEYSVPLSQYEGQTVRLAIHYTSYDAFMAQLDDVTVEPAEGENETVDYGNVEYFEIFLDGERHGTSDTPEYVISEFPEGQHVIGIRAVYKSGTSSIVEYTVGQTGIDNIMLDPVGGEEALYDIFGRKVDASQAGAGVYIRVKDGKSSKVIR